VFVVRLNVAHGSQIDDVVSILLLTKHEYDPLLLRKHYICTVANYRFCPTSMGEQTRARTILWESGQVLEPFLRRLDECQNYFIGAYESALGVLGKWACKGDILQEAGQLQR
jgi:hypothetical protein